MTAATTMVASSSMFIPSDTLILPVSVVTVAVVSIALTRLSEGNSLDKKVTVNLTFILPFLKMRKYLPFSHRPLCYGPALSPYNSTYHRLRMAS